MTQIRIKSFGSARHEFGCKAPFLWIGLSVARQCRQAGLNILFSAAALLVLQIGSQASAGPASAAFEYCQNVAQMENKASPELLAAGFEFFNSKNKADFAKVLIDGVIIATATPRQLAFDWKTQEAAAIELVSLVTLSNMGGSVRKYYAPGANGASLFVGDRLSETSNVIHCIFAGPEDAELRQLFDTIARADKSAGIQMSPEEFQLVTIRSSNGNVTIDAQIARYMQSMESILGREQNAEMGFSLISSKPK